MTPDYVRLMVRYNGWQNFSLLTAASGLSDDERRADRGAFFGSIHGTLNHILWADRLWMSRFSDWPAPSEKGFTASAGAAVSWADYVAARREADDRLIEWAKTLAPDAFEGNLSWFSKAIGREITQPRGLLVVHMFNHQTHHRGQAHAMLTASGATPDDTDIPFMPTRFEEIPVQ